MSTCSLVGAEWGGLSTEAWAKLWINNFHIMTNIALLTVKRACLLMSPVSITLPVKTIYESG